MKHLARSNLSDQLARILGSRIIKNELKSGEILHETKISKQWGVSRSPVRDALHMLVQYRLLEKTTSGSYKVTEMTRDYILNFYDTANIIYQYAFAKAAENATKNDIRELKAALDKIEESLETNNFGIYVEGVTECGKIVLRIAGNPIVEKIAMELMPTAERVQYSTLSILPNYLETMVAFVRKGYQHITEGNPQQAAQDFADFAEVHKQINLDNISPKKASDPVLRGTK